jgi:hypothetical protein
LHITSDWISTGIKRTFWRQRVSTSIQFNYLFNVYTLPFFFLRVGGLRFLFVVFLKSSTKTVVFRYELKYPE